MNEGQSNSPDLYSDVLGPVASISPPAPLLEPHPPPAATTASAPVQSPLAGADLNEFDSNSEDEAPGGGPSSELLNSVLSGVELPLLSPDPVSPLSSPNPLGPGPSSPGQQVPASLGSSVGSSQQLFQSWLHSNNLCFPAMPSVDSDDVFGLGEGAVGAAATSSGFQDLFVLPTSEELTEWQTKTAALGLPLVPKFVKRFKSLLNNGELVGFLRGARCEEKLNIFDFLAALLALDCISSETAISVRDEIFRCIVGDRITPSSSCSVKRSPGQVSFAVLEAVRDELAGVLFGADYAKRIKERLDGKVEDAFRFQVKFGDNMKSRTDAAVREALAKAEERQDGQIRARLDEYERRDRGERKRSRDRDDGPSGGKQKNNNNKDVCEDWLERVRDAKTRWDVPKDCGQSGCSMKHGRDITVSRLRHVLQRLFKVENMSEDILKSATGRG